jgi:multiple sugar transport system substrate-binding protein
LSYLAWTFEPDTHQQLLRTFESQNPGYKVDFTNVASPQYPDKVAAIFAAGQQVDVLLVVDNNVAAWAESGYLQPVDGQPGLDTLNSAMIPYVLDGMKYKGKQYGLPYYADFAVFTYNDDLLAKAGVQSPPKTFDDLKAAAQAVKQKAGIQYPIIFDGKQRFTGMDFWWTLVYGSGGTLFDAQGAPTFPTPDDTAEKVLNWLVSAMNDWQILDPSSLETEINNLRDTYGGGQAAFTVDQRYELRRMNDPSAAKIAGHAKMALVPTLTGAAPGTEGWTRLYAMGGTAKNKADAWKLLKFMGGTDNTGAYVTARRWVELQGLGAGYAAVMDDPATTKAYSQWIDTGLSGQQSKTAKNRENSKQPWYPDWEVVNQQQIQNALLNKISARDALMASADKARELRQKAG